MEPRSYLYVPADQPAMLAKADQREADALIIDLEDAVTSGAKDKARQGLRKWLGESSPSSRCEIWVRVNNQSERLMDDVAAADHPRVYGIFLPKADLKTLAQTVARLDQTQSSLRVAAQIETATGLLQAGDLVGVDRVVALSLGEADLAANLRADPSPDESEWVAARSHLVWVSAAAGIRPPIGGVVTDFRDSPRLEETTERLRRLGFGSRTAIHPAQVPIINRVFTPDSAEIERARAVLEVFNQAVARGEGVAVDAGGRMVDEAVARNARLVLERAGEDV